MDRKMTYFNIFRNMSTRKSKHKLVIEAFLVNRWKISPAELSFINKLQNK